MNKRHIISYLSFIGILSLFFISAATAANKPFTVVIDPGHGGKDPGAIGKTAKEKTINLNVALELGRLIEANHPQTRVVYTRKSDIFIELNQRAEIANRAKADLFISIHTNAARSSSARGTETYTLGLARSEENLEVAKRENSAILLEDNYMEKYEGFDPNSTESYIIFEFIQNKHLEQSVNVASYIQKEFFQTAKRGDRGVRQAGFLVLRKTSMPSVLVELGYISNPEEEKYLASANGQKTLAKCIYNSFIKMKQNYDKKNKTAETQSASSDDSGIASTAVTPVTKTEKVKLPRLEEDSATQKETITPAAKTEISQTSPGKITYKVQILTSDKKLSLNDRRFKGYKDISFYKDNGMYKYTIGESATLDECNKIRKKLLPDFKDAFVVRFVDGVRKNQ